MTKKYRISAGLRSVEGYSTVKLPALHDELLSEKCQSVATTIVGRNGLYKQTIVLDRNIGKAYAKNGRKVNSNTVRVEYHPNYGMHYYPITPEQAGDNK